MEKRKITVDISGNPITLVTDEPEDFVELLTETISARIGEMTKNSIRNSTLDACLLLSLDYLGDKLRAEARIRELESELSVRDVAINNLKDKLAEMQKLAENLQKKDENSEEECEKMLDLFDSNESRVAALEKYIDSGSHHNGGRTREEKIRYIESLLRGNDDK